jgi:hypothetical protein
VTRVFYTYKELIVIEELYYNEKLNLGKIVEIINHAFHNEQPVRTECAIKNVLRKMNEDPKWFNRIKERDDKNAKRS